MKYLIIITLALLSSSAFSQTKVEITRDQFLAISINGISVSQIGDTKGLVANISSVLGTPAEQAVDDDGIDFMAKYTYPGFYLRFSTVGYKYDEGAKLIWFEVSNNQALIKVAGKEVKLGDNVSVLGNYNPKPIPGNRHVSYHQPGGSSFLTFTFNGDTGIINRINYMVLN